MGGSQAPLEPHQSAEAIYQRITKRPELDGPLPFIDYKGVQGIF
ncbi:hypothetical protein [Amphibacillus cookii]|nr:hypothetical protein [Amphibacillus cookii]MBM7540714.1 hypothetical protein [Amphibacillus cookii]